MGLDTLEPFLALAEREDKGVAVLVRTSNPGARDLQDLQVGGAPLWRRAGGNARAASARLKGASGWSGLMAVAGATYPDEARALREAMPDALFLVPGYGAQGASAADAVAGFVTGTYGREGGVVTSSRAVPTRQRRTAAKTLANGARRSARPMAAAVPNCEPLAPRDARQTERSSAKARSRGSRHMARETFHAQEFRARFGRIAPCASQRPPSPTGRAMPGPTSPRRLCARAPQPTPAEAAAPDGRTGQIPLVDGALTLNVPQGYRFYSAEEANAFVAAQQRGRAQRHRARPARARER